MAGTSGDISLKLKSGQGEVFEVPRDVACMSTLVANMVEDGSCDEEIPLPNVKTAILAKVIFIVKLLYERHGTGHAQMITEFELPPSLSFKELFLVARRVNVF